MEDGVRTNLDVDGHYLRGMVAQKIEADNVGHLDFFVKDADAEGLLSSVG